MAVLTATLIIVVTFLAGYLFRNSSMDKLPPKDLKAALWKNLVVNQDKTKFTQKK